MKKKEKILNRQNEDLMLKALFTSGKYFDRSQLCNTFIWIAYLILLLIPLFTDNELFISLSEYAINITVIIIAYYSKKCAMIGANIRNYFDAYVYEMKLNDYTNEQLSDIKSQIFKCCKKNQKQCQIKISNTGEDKPNGFKNWYELDGNYNDKDAIYHCQKQNSLFYNKTIKYDYLSYIVAGLVVVLIFVLQSNEYGMIGAMVRSGGIIVSLILILCDVYHRNKITSKINDNVHILEFGHGMGNIIELQEQINERRKCVVLNVGYIYKYLVKDIIEEFRFIYNKY